MEPDNANVNTNEQGCDRVYCRNLTLTATDFIFGFRAGVTSGKT